jgi:hypothetical protein
MFNIGIFRKGVSYVRLFQNSGSDSRFLYQFFDINASMGRFCTANRVTEDQLCAGHAGDDHNLAGRGAALCGRSEAGLVYQTVPIEFFNNVQ